VTVQLDDRTCRSPRAVLPTSACHSSSFGGGPKVGFVTALLAPLLVLLIVVATDLWVYADAKRCAAEGSPVLLRIGSFAIDTPVAWLVGCAVLWIFFFPMYFVSRSGT